MIIREEDVIPKLRNVKEIANGWTASCPSHYPDKHPSFSILRMNDGNLWLECHKECSFVHIVQALGLNEHEQRKSARNSFKKIIAEYDYFDGDGEMVYQVVKYEPKNFNFRRPDGNGGWIWNLQGVKKIPYQLPDLIHARIEGLPVFLCEGEKDVDNLRKMGLTATTTPHGSNSWSNDYAEYFDGLDVVILPDNDSAGKKYANDAATSLWGTTNSLKVIKLPNLLDKQDVSDWIQAGGNSEELEVLTSETDEWTPDRISEEKNLADVSNNKDFFVIKPANQWIKEAKTKPIPKMLLHKLWYEDEICMLFADSNVGKSILAVQIADSITEGNEIRPFMIEVEPQKVLYFDFELGERQFLNRYASSNEEGFFENEYKFNENFIRVNINPDADLSSDSSFESKLFTALEDAVNYTGAKILIVDNITYLRTNNEKAKEALALMKYLKHLKEKYNLSILVLAHTPKRFLDKPITQNDLAGSKMLMNFCDSSFAIGKSGKDEKLRYIKQIKVRNTEEFYGADNVVVCQIENPSNFTSFRFLNYGTEQDLLKPLGDRERDELIEQVGELKAKAYTTKQISERLGIATGTVSNYAKEFIERHKDDVQIDNPLYDLNNMNRMNNDEDPSMKI